MCIAILKFFLSVFGLIFLTLPVFSYTINMLFSKKCMGLKNNQLPLYKRFGEKEVLFT